VSGDRDGRPRVPDAALLLPSFHGGGLERVMLNIADGLVAQGLAADLVVAWPKGSYADQVPRGVRVVPLEAPRMLRAMPPLVAYLRRERPRSLLAGLDYANVLAIWARRLASVPTRVVVSSHKDFTLSVGRSPLRRERWLLPTAVRLSYPMAEAVVSVSDDLADDLARVARIPRSRITVIHNPIVTEELLAAARAPIEHPWFADGGPPVLLAAGRLTAQKDYPTLLRAFRTAREARALRLVVLGEGEERGRLEALARELGVAPEVDFAGFVANPYAFMARASLFVVSSAWEGLPTVMVEAMACGAPVVSTDCPSGPGEILERGRYGRLVAVGDAAALAGAMLATLDDPPPPELLRRRAGEFGPEQAIERFRAVLEA
jgi:glycosyltransferase involved in cell wall biosynthesis